MPSHFIEVMETAQRPLEFFRFACFRHLVLAASHVPGLGQTRTILNADNCNQPCMTHKRPLVGLLSLARIQTSRLTT